MAVNSSYCTKHRELLLFVGSTSIPGQAPRGHSLTKITSLLCSNLPLFCWYVWIYAVLTSLQKESVASPAIYKVLWTNTTTSAAYFLNHVLPPTRSTREPPLAWVFPICVNKSDVAYLWLCVASAKGQLWIISGPCFPGDDLKFMCEWPIPHTFWTNTFLGYSIIVSLIQCTEELSVSIRDPQRGLHSSFKVHYMSLPLCLW